jgi:glutamate transport system substrate-binding protein
VAGVWTDDEDNRNDKADSSYNEDVTMGLLDRVDFEGDITFKKVAREGAMFSLTSRQVDIFGTLGITVSREREVDFVGPLASSRLGVLVRHQETDIKRISDLSRRSTCVIASSTAVDDLMKAEKEARIIMERNNSSCLSGLLAGKVDAIVGDRLTLAGIQLANRRDTKLVEGVRFGRRTSTGFAIPKGNRDTCERLRAALHNYVGSEDWRNYYSIRLPLTQDFIDAQPTSEEINEMSCRASAAG